VGLKGTLVSGKEKLGNNNSEIPLRKSVMMEESKNKGCVSAKGMPPVQESNPRNIDRVAR
jgi:hypothetical protein